MRAARTHASTGVPHKRPNVGANVELPPVKPLPASATIADDELAAVAYALEVAPRFPAVPERNIARAAFRALTTARQRYTDPESDHALERLCPRHHPSHERGPSLANPSRGGLPSLARQYANGIDGARLAEDDDLDETDVAEPDEPAPF